MTTQHILYIPTIFFIGFLVGTLSSRPGHVDNNVSAAVTRSKSRRRLIQGSFLIGSFLVFAVALVATHIFELPASAKSVTKSLGGLELFDRKLSFSSMEVYSRIGSFPEPGIQLYKRFTYTFDVLFPVTLFTFLLLLSRFVTHRFLIHRRLMQILHALPIIWFGSDLLENAVVYSLLNEFPTRHHMLAGTLGYITITKFSFLLLSVIGPAVATMKCRVSATLLHKI